MYWSRMNRFEQALVFCINVFGIALWVQKLGEVWYLKKKKKLLGMIALELTLFVCFSVYLFICLSVSQYHWVWYKFWENMIASWCYSCEIKWIPSLSFADLVLFTISVVLHSAPSATQSFLLSLTMLTSVLSTALPILSICSS